MNKSFTLVLAPGITVMLLLVACGEDYITCRGLGTLVKSHIPCLEDDTIVGDYVGSVGLRIGNQETVSQNVHWRFEETTYSMWLRGDEALREFCDVSGEYKLGSGFELTPDTAWTTDMQICDDSRTPRGIFSLDRSTDTLKLTRYVSEADMMWIIEILRQ